MQDVITRSVKLGAQHANETDYEGKFATCTAIMNRNAKIAKF